MCSGNSFNEWMNFTLHVEMCISHAMKSITKNSSTNNTTNYRKHLLNENKRLNSLDTLQVLFAFACL